MKNVYIDKDGRIFEGQAAEWFVESDDLIDHLNKLNIKHSSKKDKKSKGGNIMKRLFKTKDSGRVVEFNKEDSKIKRQVKVIGEVVNMSIEGTFSDPWTYAAVASVGLNQGLKYKGDFKAGGKAGLATAAVVAGFNVVGNLVINKEAIKDA